MKGDINADTFLADPTNGHFATTIELVTYPGVAAIGDDFSDGTFVRARNITLANGASARETSQVNGLGAIRIEWTMGGNSYLLLSSHWKTTQGTSGIGTADLERMAGSIG